MANQLVYDYKKCIKLIKKKYPLIPKGIIRRVLFANDLYMRKVGIIKWNPQLKDWK